MFGIIRLRKITMNIFSNTVVQPMLGIALAGLIALTPAIGLANNDNGNKSNTVQKIVSVDVSINNGRVNVNGAKVTAVSGNTITANTSWGSSNLIWNVKIGSSTIVKDARGKGKTPVTQIVAGDTINFKGSLDTGLSGLTVNATQVKDLTRNATDSSTEKHVFEGKLQALATTSLPTSFTLLINSINYTVNVPSNALILAKNWTAIALSSFVVGDTVRVFGSLQTSTSTVIDALVVRNASR